MTVIPIDELIVGPVLFGGLKPDYWRFISNMLTVMINFNIAFTIISVVCYLIMSQELGRLGNEKLLN